MFGKADGFAASMDLGDLNGQDGFRVDGIVPLDYAGWSVSDAGDFNGDGYDDLLVGAYAADNGGSGSGSAYLIYGKEG